MTSRLLERTQTTFAELGQNGSWVTAESVLPRKGAHLQTQLLFNHALPASALNRATQVGPPPPIVIEKLVPGSVAWDGEGSARSSLCFSVLSEERLQAAVRLARRDLRRRRQQPAHSHPPQSQPEEKSLGSSGVVHHQQRQTISKAKGEVTKSGARVFVYSPQKLPLPCRADPGRSPPTRDPGPGSKVSSQEPQLSREIGRLQKELDIYIQRIEHLTDKGRMASEPLDPEDERRAQIRRQEQAARAARIIYVLQQQVKEIQEDLDKLRSQKIRHTKKSRAMDRLAAAHRGAVRAIQVFISQLSDQSESRMPSHYRELGQLIRQLSLCSAKIEVGRGSSVPETAIDILQKLEALDSLLSKQEGPRKTEARVRSSSPARQRQPPSPSRAPRGQAAKGTQRPLKPAPVKKSFPGRRLAAPHVRINRPSNPGRSEVLRAGLENLIRNHKLREAAGELGEEPHVPANHREVPLSERSKGAPAGFQQPTVSSRLKENQLPQREAPVPWVPTSPHASPPRRSLPGRAEPRCLFPPPKPPASPREQQASPRGLASDKMRQAHREALRQAWLDRETMKRLEELDRFSKEEAERIRRLRAEAPSPTQWAERAERAARDRLEPLLGRAQEIGQSWDRRGVSLRHRLSEQAADKAVASADLLSEALLEELLEDTARALWASERDRQAEGLAEQHLEKPTLESMLLRMEEMERDQEAVRQRFTHIAYSDPRSWATGRETGDDRAPPGPGPLSPRPIRITRPALRQDPKVDIVLESPLETGVLSDSSVPEESPCRVRTSAGERGGGWLLSLPADVQRNIHRYRQEYEAYLRLVSHEAVGNFNPWAIADSLAEELMSEALSDVAAEFQDVCEEYAEAVFTSEFLQPIESPPV